jgi:uncharacterized protein
VPTSALSRLRTLRQQSGGKSEVHSSSAITPSATTAPVLTTLRATAADARGLSDDFEVSARRRLQALVGARPGQATRTSEAELAQKIDGTLVAPGVIKITRRSEYNEPTSQYLIPPNTLTSVGQLQRSEVPKKIVVLDTETTGLAGGTGTVAFVVGALVLDGDGITLHQWLLSQFQGETAALSDLAAIVEGADALVTYNGSSFDLPLLDTRFLLAGVRSGIRDCAHLDLLGPMRRAFSGRWLDCRLQTAERRLLKVARPDDLPGAEVPEQWFKWMRYGDAHGVGAVVRHNRDDVYGLAALVAPMARIMANPAQFGARIVSVLNGRITDPELYTYLQTHVGKLDEQDCLELARLAKRLGAWHQAEAALMKLVNSGHDLATEQLAKLYEHQLKQLPRALDLTRALIIKQPAVAALRRREERVLRKLESAQSVRTTC